MQESSKLSGVMRGVAPCKNCAERHEACWDKCPKDLRGEYGYNAWMAEANRVKAEKQRYLDRTSVRKKNYHGGHNHGEERLYCQAAAKGKGLF